MLLGDHAFPVLAAYALSIGALAALVAVSFAQARAAARQLKRAEGGDGEV